MTETGYAPVNGLQMYYEVHGDGGGRPLVLLHGNLSTIGVDSAPQEWPSRAVLARPW